MTNNGDPVGQLNSAVSAEVLISQVGSQEWRNIDPESVECSQTESSSLTSTESSWQDTGRRVVASGTSLGAGRQGVLDKVGEHDGGTIVGETLSQFTNGNEVTGNRNSVRYSSQRRKLFFGGVDIIGVERVEILFLDFGRLNLFVGITKTLLVVTNGVNLVGRLEFGGAPPRWSICSTLAMSSR